MKKILLFGLIALIGLISQGCGLTKTTDTTTTQTTLSPLELQGYTVEMMSYDAPLFDVEITDVVIEVAYRKIHFHYEIHDYSSMYDYYFVYGYESKTFRPFHPISSRDKKASGDYTLDLLYDEDHPDKSVTIEMGRYSESAVINEERPASNSAGFRYVINQIQNRNLFEDDYFYFFHDPIDPLDGKVELGVDDEDSIITSIKFVLTDYTNGNVFVAQSIKPVDSTMRIDGKIILSETLFFDFTSGVRYQVVVYVSGNDGLYDFVDIPIEIKQLVA